MSPACHFLEDGGDGFGLDDAQFGKDFCTELCRTPEGRAEAQDAIDRYFPMMLPFFGRPRSENSALFRRRGIKQRSNEEMRDDFIARARAVVESHLGLKLPAFEPA
ncbi:MAG: Phenylacetic acid catabolic protein [Stellaceae bacterium]